MLENTLLNLSVDASLAKHMRDALPKASFIGFTGTPIESGDKNTQAVFGDLASQARHHLVSQHYHSRFARRGH